MPNRNELRRKLKASDRRRRRRPGPSERPAEERREDDSVAKTDVAGMLIEAILEGEVGGGLGDATIVAALRACLRGKAPSGDVAASLYLRLDAILGKDGVKPQAFRAAVSDLLTEAQRHEKSREDRFLSYLSLLAS